MCQSWCNSFNPIVATYFWDATITMLSLCHRLWEKMPSNCWGPSTPHPPRSQGQLLQSRITAITAESSPAASHFWLQFMELVAIGSFFGDVQDFLQGQAARVQLTAISKPMGREVLSITIYHNDRDTKSFLTGSSKANVSNKTKIWDKNKPKETGKKNGWTCEPIAASIRS